VDIRRLPFSAPVFSGNFASDDNVIAEEVLYLRVFLSVLAKESERYIRQGMGRKRQPPRLWLDKRRRDWVILDGPRFIRTGCAEADRANAEKELASYLSRKYEPPAKHADPLIADVFIAYAKEHVTNTRTANNTLCFLQVLLRWWGDKRVSDINHANTKAFIEASTSPLAARRYLETLRAAVNHWHKWHGPLQTVPSVILPAKAEPRERWMTRGEAARLLWSARHTSHVARFILLGLYTGSRPGVLVNLEWSWIDLEHRIMSRRAPGTSEAKNKRTPKVKLGKRILAHLRRWKRIDGPHCKHVVHYNGQCVKTLRHSFPAAVKAAGLDDGVTPHTMRHTRATWIMQKGVDPWKAAGHLGMSVKTLISVYGHHHPDYQEEAAEV
jgi:integrase